MLNSDVVFGRKRLDHLFRLFDAGRIDESELASIGLQRTDLQGKRGKEVEAEYRESFPTRLILNGLLRVLWSERSALDERSPPE